jgi:hypothetical protein
MIGRMIATGVIWIATISAIITLLTSPTGAIAHADGAVAFGIVLVLAIAAATSTLPIWLSARESGQQVREIPVAKAKRVHEDRVARLVDSLSDDEIYRLEALLLARDDDTAHHQQ